MKRNFSDWLSTFHDSIATYSYYVDFEKVYGNVDSIKIELNILNSLIGSKNIKADFEKVLQKYPETLKTKADADNVTILNIELQIELSADAINTVIINEAGNLATEEKLQEYFKNIKIASHAEAGIVKIGENVYIDETGAISVKQTSGYALFDTVIKTHKLSYEESEGLTLQGEYAYAEAAAASENELSAPAAATIYSYLLLSKVISPVEIEYEILGLASRVFSGVKTLKS